MNTASFAIPKPLMPLFDRHEVGGVFMKPAHYFEEFFITVISASPMPDGDFERWADIAPIDVGFVHVSPLQLRHGFNGALRNYALWHSRHESFHFQKKDRDESRLFGLTKNKQFTRYWAIPEQINEHVSLTHFGNTHLVGVDPELTALMRPGCVLKMSGHSLNWASVGDDGSIFAVEGKGRKFGTGANECVLFLPDALEIIEPEVVRKITSASGIKRLSDKSFVTLIEQRNNLFLLENKETTAQLISNLPCVINDQQNTRGTIKLDHSIHKVVGRTKILMASLFWLFQLSFSDRRMFVQMNRYGSDGGNWSQLSWRAKIAFACLNVCLNPSSDDIASKLVSVLLAIFLLCAWLGKRALVWGMSKMIHS